MPPSVACVAENMNLGLMAALCVACRWPDKNLVHDFFRGFPIVGQLPDSGVLRPGSFPAEGELAEITKKAQCAARTQRSLVTLKSDAKFVADAANKHVRNGIAVGPFTADQLDAQFGKGEWSFCPSFIQRNPLEKDA